MARGDTLLSPYVQSFPDYLGRALTISVAFNDSTRALGATTVTRDAGCLWGTLLVGDPNGAVKMFPVPFGTSTVTRQRLNQNGLTTFEDFIVLNLTASA